MLPEGLRQRPPGPGLSLPPTVTNPTPQLGIIFEGLGGHPSVREERRNSQWWEKQMGVGT